MRVRRRISATFKDLPGGQVLGPTFDYTHRLLEMPAADPPEPATTESDVADSVGTPMPRVTDLLAADDLIERSPGAGEIDDAAPPGDLTREALSSTTTPAGSASSCGG